MKEVWENAKKESFGNANQLTLGKYLSAMLQIDPKAVTFLFSKYKFASKFLGRGKNILEIGCGEGYGSLLLAENANSITGIDFDEEAIDYANKTFANDKIQFILGDFMNYSFQEKFDACVSFDVIEYIPTELEELFLENICKNLTPHGIAIISTPNVTAFEYANPIAKKMHINNYSYERLISLFEKYFYNVVLFSRNDEVIHTGFYPMAHHLIAVGISVK